ncbi:cellulose biosynthesis protein BcsR [Halomonas sp. I1]|uniref:cellulose biosynthesis protein BcsR n=1 Tax=Halomonas sp. I1 TaxID=393536 RepID=UPI0028DD996C|nr:cellulose biosynthesis protein BcsR [Halomonas sp. I1]MDT8896321.1 cellulose biosynthesis protein BcsR [Halomonas sp. I1]
MSTHDLIIPHHAPVALRYDDDIQALLLKAGLTGFPYRNIAEQEQLAADLARWPLLAETTLARSEHDT